MEKKIKVALLYRVIQHWRAPMFERLSKIKDLDLVIYYGADFKGTRVVSGDNLTNFQNKKLPTWKISKKFGGTGVRQMPFCPTLFWQLIKSSPDVVLTEGVSNFANALQGFLYAKIFKKKIIWWGLGRLQNEDTGSKKDKFINFFEKRCDAHIVYSTVGKNYYTSIGYPNEKIFTAVNVVNTDQIGNIIQTKDFKELREGHNNFNILYVGALTKSKKIDMLIQAFNKLCEKYNDIFLNIVGDGPEKDALEALVIKMDTDHVTFAGQVIDNLYKYFAISDIFVLPGLGGLAISEAMAYGLPVIASIGDGCETDLIASTNGIVDIELNENSLSKYLEEFYINRIKLKKSKKSSFHRIKTKYNVNTYINEINRAIHSVTEKTN